MENKFKIFLILGILVLLIGIATSDILKNSLSTSETEALERIGITNYLITNSDLGNWTQRCLTQDKVLKTCKKFEKSYFTCVEGNATTKECFRRVEVFYTTEQMDKFMDDWEDERLRLIANAVVDRENRRVIKDVK